MAIDSSIPATVIHEELFCESIAFVGLILLYLQQW